MNSERHWSKNELVQFMDRWTAVTIPVNATMAEAQTALDLSRAFEVLDKADRLAVAECVCRKTLQNCSAPREVCLWIDDAADKLFQNGRAKWLAKADAKEILRQTHAAGLVHLALTPPKALEKQPPSVLCSCCTCCCHALQGLLLLNEKRAVEPSELVATYDAESCSLCGNCIERCQFNARSWGDEDEVVFDPDKCFGCGLCATTCPKQAIQLIKRSI